MLTKADDFPVHQLPEPIATSGTDRNFYDRYFFNGYSPDGSVFFAVALGVYPHLNVMDASFSVIADGIQHNLRASRILNSERLDTTVGPIKVEVIEPLRTLKVSVGENPHGIRAEIFFKARAKPVEEPRFTYRHGPRTFMDYTRLTQNGAYEGTIDVQGKRTCFRLPRSSAPATAPGACGRSASSDPQPTLPIRPPQFYWLWSPLNFADRFMLYHNNADGYGRPWNTASVIGSLGDAEPVHMASCKARDRLQVRHPPCEALRHRHGRSGGPRLAGHAVPQYNFYMSGIGYTHPEWGHGHYKGENALGYDTYDIATVNEKVPLYWHVQAFSTVQLTGPDVDSKGTGVLEQLVIGAHEPSGFTGLMDVAP